MQMIDRALSPEMLKAFKKSLEQEGQPKVSKCDPIDDEAQKRIEAREKILKVLAGGDGGSSI